LRTHRVSGEKDNVKATLKAGRNDTYCVRLDAHEYPRTAALVLLVVNKNMKTADNIVKTASENFLPPMVHPPTPRVISTTAQAMSDPGMHRTEMIA
jgi:hypothetical protein